VAKGWGSIIKHDMLLYSLSTHVTMVVLLNSPSHMWRERIVTEQKAMITANCHKVTQICRHVIVFLSKRFLSLGYKDFVILKFVVFLRTIQNSSFIEWCLYEFEEAPRLIFCLFTSMWLYTLILSKWHSFEGLLAFEKAF
jgi:hypothetical protein